VPSWETHAASLELTDRMGEPGRSAAQRRAAL